ncbi:MAG: purine-binding chemotaxis protein CheW [Gammaproteobacteria bacterium]|nr:purine-binding chemotaxis protein CheW [Gammaproteobacteria bacterium]
MQPMATAITGSEDNLQQYLSFMLAGEEYASNILKVQEIRDWTSSTLIPNSPDYLEGVLNLRGDIIPIINLRTRFFLPPSEQTEQRIVIVLNIESMGKRRAMGLLVDAVAETYDVDLNKVRPAPASCCVIEDDFISGLITVDEKMIILLDVDQLLNSGLLGLT